MMHEIDKHIYKAAVTLPLIVGDEEMKKLVNGRMTEEEYDVVVKKISEFSSIWNIDAIYQRKREGAGIVNVIASATGQELRDDVFPHYGEPTPALSDMLHVLETGETVFLSSTGRWGEFRSVYVPLRQPNGEVHLVGADKPLREVRAMLRAEAVKIVAYGLLFLVFAVPLVYLTYRSLRHVLWELQKNYARLMRVSEQYKALSYLDPLTGIYNRRAFFENAHRAVAHALRTGRPLFALALDIDHFKQVNDTWGHTGGDLVLTGLVDLLRAQLRREDIIGRCGGEEFGVILPETTPEGAAMTAERLREACADYPFTMESGARITVTISVGLAQMEMLDARTPSAVEEALKITLRQADEALYRAKDAGRNRVCAYAGPAADPCGAGDGGTDGRGAEKDRLLT